MKAIYKYVVDFAVARGGKALDYGCGRGEVVEAARQAGLDMVGADVFYAGNDARQIVTEKGVLGRSLFEMVDGRLPFADAQFDVVVSTQVLEHVVDLEQALSEIARVLRPGGVFLALFPTRESWREGHCGVPFAHWFPAGSRLRFGYLCAMRWLGIGYEKEGRSRTAFAREWGEYLDRFTAYRTLQQIEATYARYFSHQRRVEADYVAYRLRARGSRALASIAALPVAAPLAAWACFKLAGPVVLAER